MAKRHEAIDVLGEAVADIAATLANLDTAEAIIVLKAVAQLYKGEFWIEENG